MENKPTKMEAEEDTQNAVANLSRLCRLVKEQPDVVEDPPHNKDNTPRISQ